MKTRSITSPVLTAILATAALVETSPAAPRGQLGILTPATLAGNNPATGAPWATGDTYRFAFFTSVRTTAQSTDIETYNAFVQNLADVTSTYAGFYIDDIIVTGNTP